MRPSLLIFTFGLWHFAAAGPLYPIYLYKRSLNTTSPETNSDSGPGASQKQTGSVPALAVGPNSPEPGKVLASLSLASALAGSTTTSYSRSFTLNPGSENTIGTATGLPLSAVPSTGSGVEDGGSQFGSITTTLETSAVAAGPLPLFSNTSLPAVATVPPAAATGGVVGTSTTTITMTVPPTTPIISSIATSNSSAFPSAASSTAPEQPNNIAMALMFNAIYATMSTNSSCDPNNEAQRVACISGALANCRPDGTYITADCPGNQKCFALPLPGSDVNGISIQCEDPAKADEELGLAASSPSVTTVAAGAVPSSIVPSPSSFAASSLQSPAQASATLVESAATSDAADSTILISSTTTIFITTELAAATTTGSFQVPVPAASASASPITTEALQSSIPAVPSSPSAAATSRDPILTIIPMDSLIPSGSLPTVTETVTVTVTVQ